MTFYAKIFCDALTDAKLLAVGPEGFTLWVKGILYSKQHTTDGVVPIEALPLIGLGLKDAEATKDLLIKYGLWIETADGFGVDPVKWAKYQTTKSDIERVRTLNRDRKNKQRERDKSRGHDDVTQPSRESHATRETERQRDRETEVKTPSPLLQGGGPPPQKIAGQKQKTQVADSSAEPFRSVEKLLALVAEGLGTDPPIASECRRYLRSGSPVRNLIEKYGVDEAAQIAIYAMNHSPGCGWARIWEANASFAKQSRDGLPPLSKNGATTKTFEESTRENLALLENP